MQKHLWKEYFTFSKKERNAIIILIALLLFFIILPFFIPSKREVPIIDKEAQALLAQLQQYADSANLNYEAKPYYSSADLNSGVNYSKAELFNFNPNTLQADGWKKLGLRDKTIQTILNYRSKGGQFRKPDDIRKIYGLRQEEADRLIPFVRIGSDAGSKEYSGYAGYSKEKYMQKKKTGLPKIDINNSNAEDWKAFPGIGDVLSNRIIKYRTSIGGFTSIDQVKKTYGLADSVFQIIRPYLTLSISDPPKNSSGQ